MSRTRYALLGALALALAAVFSYGHHHADEHFQILEFAGWKLGLTPAEALPWEFAAQLRPTLQPAMVVVLYRTCDLFGTPAPFLITLLLRLFTAALAFAGTLLLVQGQFRNDALLRDPVLEKWYLFLSYGLWFTVYAAVRFSSEGLSSALFLLGTAVFLHHMDRRPDLRSLTVGVLLGLAFVVRYQTGFMIAGLLLWALLIERRNFGRLALTTGGIIFAVGLGIVVDRWFYGTWSLTLWTYFAENLLAGRAASFGTEPWWYYFKEIILRGIPPFSVILLAAALIAMLFRPRQASTWIVAPFLLAHLLIGHKELRFLFPLLGFLPILVVHGLAEVRQRWWPAMLHARPVRFLVQAFLVIHVAVLLVTVFKPAEGDVALFRAVHDTYRDPITLYHGERKPFGNMEHIHFYRRPGLKITAWPEQGVPTDARFLFIGTVSEPPTAPGYAALLIHRSLPLWVDRINFGGWVERTQRWYIWELTRQ